MRTRRSARVRAGSASRETANNPQENNTVQRKRRAGKTATEKENQNIEKQVTQQKAPQPLRDVTNNIQNTRSGRPRKPAAKPAVKLSADIDDEITPAPQHCRTTRRSKQALHSSESSHEIAPADLHVAKTKRKAGAEKPCKDKDDGITPTFRRRIARPGKQPLPPSASSNEIAPADSPVGTTIRGGVEAEKPCEGIENQITPTSQLRNRSPPSVSLQGRRAADSPNGIMRRHIEFEEASSDEICPNPPKRNPRTTAPAPQSSCDEIRPNPSTQRRRVLSVLPQSADEIRPGPAQTERPSVPIIERFHTRLVNPAISDSPPISPLPAKQQTETHQTSWPDENLDPNRTAFDAKRPRQVVHTYGKRRRVARVSLPTMQALGVRAKSPSSGSQGSSEKEEDEDVSEEYKESEDESENKPKRDPQLQAFLAEQRKLWQEVDETDLLVESD